MIRKATKEDLEEILSIIQVVKKKMAESGNPQWDADYPGEKEYSKDIENEELFVDTSEEGINRFMTINDHFPVEYEHVKWNTLSPAYTIHRLAVNPEFRNRGTAGKMFAYAETWLAGKGVKSIRLDTFSKNEAAQRLFKKMVIVL